MPEKRRFRRATLDASCALTKGDIRLDLQLVNVSLRGFLTRAPASSSLPVGTDGTMEVRLPGATIWAQVELTHREEDLLGFRIHTIDVESMIHLRRLVEVNAGRETSREELEALWKDQSG